MFIYFSSDGHLASVLFVLYRYLFSLQMKRDLMEGRLICTENTGALLASHLVQCRFCSLIVAIFCKCYVRAEANCLSDRLIDNIFCNIVLVCLGQLLIACVSTSVCVLKQGLVC